MLVSKHGGVAILGPNIAPNIAAEDKNGCPSFMEMEHK